MLPTIGKVASHIAWPKLAAVVFLFGQTVVAICKAPMQFGNSVGLVLQGGKYAVISLTPHTIPPSDKETMAGVKVVRLVMFPWSLVNAVALNPLPLLTLGIAKKLLRSWAWSGLELRVVDCDQLAVTGTIVVKFSIIATLLVGITMGQV